MKAKRLGAALAGCLLIGPALLMGANQAAAGTTVADLTCIPPSSRVTTWTPALTLAPQSVKPKTQTDYGPCVSISQPGIVSGTESTQGLTTTLSCLDLLSSGTITTTITWNTGQKTTFTGTRTANIAGAVLTNTTVGTVTSGTFAGKAVVQQQVAPALNVTACTLGLGTVSSINSSVVLEIT
ncbi:hypothetical protein EV562_1037 [Streptomyces sp. BK208]|uniref:hypothetical protein n=1 Tax=Streptomyces sp. BK208 TaxID=2512150 RepID=UPI00105C0EAF|nr:hypothetical protein [Streptomyces sp. BK208]TDT39637.1 hypothetical protein EV562_1037 [Streptomyces sp. BK208]